MPQVVIENPVLNSPFVEPKRHFRFGDEGITDEVIEERRISSYFVPIARPKKKGKQLEFDTEWTKDRIEENRLVNRIRQRVAMWRQGGYVGVTPTTSRLLQYWTNPDRERKLFSAKSKHSKPLSTSPKSPRNTATHGLKTTFATRTTPRIPAFPALPSKWQLVRVRQS